ncbi:Sensor kinase CusS [Aquisphaera giovannonii]|uniref:histidine kinase n=1 Tax=Aquisphaera giovannonii TaxID=406548 RepID=A0A5B9VYB4_9BACT|nr:ATP-binding protein [Aquisphaera giovannonii]QEH33366.1 Sensor kinase CusS [Aquisphaera giovannonii]
MSLATRISAFFLVLLGLVLAGFSCTLYALARTYLVRQLDDRLQRGLDTLEAAVDIEPGGLEWEPTDRRIALGVDSGISAVRWSIRDGGGSRVDLSANAMASDFPRDWAPASWSAPRSEATRFGDAPGWRMAGRKLVLADLLRQGRGHPDDEPGYEVQYPELVLVAGLSPAPVEAALNRLGLALVTLSAGVWVAAAAAGHVLARRALAPVRRMARVATAMTAADLGRRLPTPGTADELDEVGDAFNGLLERLSGAFDDQRRFAGAASHQLRTPLAALLGQVQVARRRDRSPEEYRRVLDRVLDEGGRLRGIVESLLFLADPEDVPVEMGTLDLARWLPEHLACWEDHTRRKDLRVEVREGGGLAARVNPHLLGQLLDNLLENAFKYSPPGSPVAVRCWSEPGVVVLGVEDRGPGLSPAELARVFDPFYRTDQARREGRPGVGLGLPVARRIAAALGGSLAATSGPGPGCLFTLRLPTEPVTDLRENETEAGHDA